ncbi:hypothetical protein BGZ60DRAFT_533574 [Tricladium varicosporioides]|nr:hypothetical protein BGZ60DRAFT_533574 [Hymenoscyphus varicosporioides]
MTSIKAKHLAQYFIEERPEGSNESSPSLIAQMEHRLKLVSLWNIKPNSRVLEIGCGQGDCTIVLADTVEESGHVDAVDPGAPDYGAPFTLSQAQSYISSSVLGPRVKFHNLNPLTYIDSYRGLAYDYIVLSHSIFYFSDPSVLPSFVKAFATLPSHMETERKTKLCIAEWSLKARGKESYPHVITSLLLSLIESKRKSESQENIRTVLSPLQISKIILTSGSFIHLRQETMETGQGMRDAYWEVRDVLRKIKESGDGMGLLEGTKDELSESEKAIIVAMGDAVFSAVNDVEGGLASVRCMDAWVAVFVRI